VAADLEYFLCGNAVTKETYENVRENDPYGRAVRTGYKWNSKTQEWEARKPANHGRDYAATAAAAVKTAATATPSEEPTTAAPSSSGEGEEETLGARLKRKKSLIVQSPEVIAGQSAQPADQPQEHTDRTEQHVVGMSVASVSHVAAVNGDVVSGTKEALDDAELVAPKRKRDEEEKLAEKRKVTETVEKLIADLGGNEKEEDHDVLALDGDQHAAARRTGKDVLSPLKALKLTRKRSHDVPQAPSRSASLPALADAVPQIPPKPTTTVAAATAGTPLFELARRPRASIDAAGKVPAKPQQKPSRAGTDAAGKVPAKPQQKPSRAGAPPHPNRALPIVIDEISSQGKKEDKRGETAGSLSRAENARSKPQKAKFAKNLSNAAPPPAAAAATAAAAAAPAPLDPRQPSQPSFSAKRPKLSRPSLPSVPRAPQSAKPMGDPGAEPSITPTIAIRKPFLIPKRSVPAANLASVVAGGGRGGDRRSLERSKAGTVRGTVWCLDNMPTWITSEGLFAALKSHVKGLIRAEVASVPLESGVSHGGYAIVVFASQADAERGSHVLKQLCVSSPGLPFPRPLLLRRPRVTSGSSSCPGGELPGHFQLRGVSTTPHFAQPNSIEFEMAIEWRAVLEQCRAARDKLHADQAFELALLLAKHLPAEQQVERSPSKGCTNPNSPATTMKRKRSSSHGGGGKHDDAPKDVALMRDVRREVPPPWIDEGAGGPPSRSVWVSGVSPRIKQEDLKEAFMQFGMLERVVVVRDKVTGDHAGHAVLTFDHADRAAMVAQNLQEMVFLAGGTPRPLSADVARPGPPRGSQSVFDRALRAVFRPWDDHNKQTSAMSVPFELVQISDQAAQDPKAVPEHRIAAEVRSLMERFIVQNDEAAKLVKQERALLVEKHENFYEQEREKLSRLQVLLGADFCKQLCRENNVVVKMLKASAAPLVRRH
jgi:hypothetical protein